MIGILSSFWMVPAAFIVHRNRSITIVLVILIFQSVTLNWAMLNVFMLAIAGALKKCLEN